MAFIVVYDADVRYPNTLRDLLIRIGPERPGAGEMDQRHPR